MKKSLLILISSLFLFGNLAYSNWECSLNSKESKTYCDKSTGLILNDSICDYNAEDLIRDFYTLTFIETPQKKESPIGRAQALELKKYIFDPLSKLTVLTSAINTDYKLRTYIFEDKVYDCTYKCPDASTTEPTTTQHHHWTVYYVVMNSKGALIDEGYWGGSPATRHALQTSEEPVWEPACVFPEKAEGKFPTPVTKPKK